MKWNETRQNARTHNGAVLRQAGCISADSLVGIWKCIARMNISVPPPERKAANTLAATRAKQRSSKLVDRKKK
jgi:hypothetical protein